MADQLKNSQPILETPEPGPGAMEWLYDTLDQEPATTRGRLDGRFPVWTVFFLLLGVALVIGLLWLLVGPRLSDQGLVSGVEATPTRIIFPLVQAAPEAPLPSVSPLTTPTPTPTPEAAFEIGDRVVVTGTASRGLRLRAGPGLDYLTLDIFQDGDAFFVMPSNTPEQTYPVEADGYRWWRVRSPDGLVGWTVEAFLVEAPLLSATPSPSSVGQ